MNHPPRLVVAVFLCVIGCGSSGQGSSTDGGTLAGGAGGSPGATGGGGSMGTGGTTAACYFISTRQTLALRSTGDGT